MHHLCVNASRLVGRSPSRMFCGSMFSSRCHHALLHRLPAAGFATRLGGAVLCKDVLSSSFRGVQTRMICRKSTYPSRRPAAMQFSAGLQIPWGKLLLGAGAAAGALLLGATVVVVVVPLGVLAVGGTLLARRLGYGPLAWIDRALRQAQLDLAANATAIQRMHYVLTSRLRSSATVHRAVGSGLELGIPIMSNTDKLPPAEYGEDAYRIQFGCALIHHNMGHRALVVIDAIRRPRSGTRSGGSQPVAKARSFGELQHAFLRAWKSAREEGASVPAAASAAASNVISSFSSQSADFVRDELEKQSELRVAQRRERQKGKPPRNPAYSTEAEEMEDAREFYEDAREDIQLEKRLRGGPVATFEGDVEIVDAVLQFPNGEKLSIAHELTGVVLDGDVIDATATGSRVIDVESWPAAEEAETPKSRKQRKR